MDSAICLCYSPLPAAPRRLSSSVRAATPGASSIHLSLSHGSLCLSRSSKHHQISRPLHINCMLDRFSEGSKKEEKDNKIVRGMKGVSLALACVLGAFNLISKMNPKSNVAYAAGLWNQGSPATAATAAETRKAPQFQPAPSEDATTNDEHFLEMKLIEILLMQVRMRISPQCWSLSLNLIVFTNCIFQPKISYLKILEGKKHIFFSV